MPSIMKRRTIDPSKLRRLPVKRARITDSVNGSWFLYLRFFIVWLVIITMDFLLEFRFEFLWPFWLLLRSSFDSFRYQGMGLTLLFLLFTLVSDVIFFVLLPVHWLFFVASTYVWVQFVCNTERGPCIANISLWLVFVYVEASVRLREIKSVPFHLDLCRPFAAHCIGYPVVSLGYGFKSYVGYKVKHYKQAEVNKTNKFYHQLVSYALPADAQDDMSVDKNVLSLTNGINSKTDTEALKRGLKPIDNDDHQLNRSLSLLDLEVIANMKDANKKNGTIDTPEIGFVKVPSRSNTSGRAPNVNTSISSKKSSKSNVLKKSIELNDNNDIDLSDSESSTTSSRVSEDSPKNAAKNNATCESLRLKVREEQLLRRKVEQQTVQLENEVKRLRNDIHNARQVEIESITQINASLVTERYLKTEIEHLKSENENLQQKINSLNNSKSQDRSLIQSLDRKLKTERDNRSVLETQLKELKELKKKSSKQELELPVITNQEIHHSCVSRRQELENEVIKLQAKLDESALNILKMQKENENLKQKSSEEEREKMKKDVEFLTNTLNAMQGKNLHLESSLSSETRLKLDLFSALGDTRRQLEILTSQMKMKCSEVDMLRAKIAEVMAVIPPQYHSFLNGFVPSIKSNSGFKNSNGIDNPVTTAGYAPPISKQNDTS